MNILIISPGLYPCITGGVEIFNHYFVRELAKRGHDIWVFTCCNYDWCNEHIHHVKMRVGFPGWDLLLFIKIIILKNKIDVIHVPYTSNSPLVFPVLLVKKIFGIPYMIAIHGGGMCPWKSKTVHKSFFRQADDIVAVSSIIKEEYEKRSGKKIKIIPPLIPFKKSKIEKDELRKQYGFSDSDKIIIFLGTIKKIKGCDVLLQAFFKLGEVYIKKNNLKLLYVGDGAMMAELKEEVESKKYNQYVKFFGKIPYEKVSQFYRMSDLYCIPSLFEGTPITLLEAMFNGLPIIGTDTNGINGLISHNKNGLLFEKENVEDLNKKIITILEDENLSKKLGRIAKNDYDTKFKFSDVVSEHVELLNNILQN